MEDETKDLIEVILQSLQFLVIVGTALWTYFRFRKENPLHPRIEFDINGKFFGPHQNACLASFTISANNKGNIEHMFPEIRLRILGVKNNEPLTLRTDLASRVNFTEEILPTVNIVPEKIGYYFVRPGVNQAFNYTTLIPDSIRYIIVRATFRYENTNELHSAERVFEVKEQPII